MSRTNQIQMLIIIRTIATVLALSFVGVLRAETPPIETGARVRISHSKGGHASGDLVRLDCNDIVIRQKGKPSEAQSSLDSPSEPLATTSVCLARIGPR